MAAVAFDRACVVPESARPMTSACTARRARRSLCPPCVSRMDRRALHPAEHAASLARHIEDDLRVESFCVHEALDGRRARSVRGSRGRSPTDGSRALEGASRVVSVDSRRRRVHPRLGRPEGRSTGCARAIDVRERRVRFAFRRWSRAGDETRKTCSTAAFNAISWFRRLFVEKRLYVYTSCALWY